MGNPKVFLRWVSLSLSICFSLTLLVVEVASDLEASYQSVTLTTEIVLALTKPTGNAMSQKQRHRPALVQEESVNSNATWRQF